MRINIGNDDVKQINIDGEEVKEIRMDGELVWRNTSNFSVHYMTSESAGVQQEGFGTGEELKQFIMDNKESFRFTLKVVATVPEITDCSYLFSGCNADIIDLSEFNTSNVTNMERMFYNCPQVWDIQFKNTETGHTSFDTGKVVNMAYMFYKCAQLWHLDVSMFNTSKVTTMYGLFADCACLELSELPNFDTSNVVYMNAMFYGCAELWELDLTNFNTSKVESFNSIFYGCSLLNSVDITGWDTSNVNNMWGMFSNCVNLSHIYRGKWDTSKVTRMDGMFYDCQNLNELDLADFDTSKVESFNSMFYGCQSLLELNLSTFNTYSLTDTQYMFYGCQSLNTIYCNDDWDLGVVTDSFDMFEDCINLVGSIEYDSSKININYANPINGYFTYIGSHIEVGDDLSGKILLFNFPDNLHLEITSSEKFIISEDGSAIETWYVSEPNLNSKSVSLSATDKYGEYFGEMLYDWESGVNTNQTQFILNPGEFGIVSTVNKNHPAYQYIKVVHKTD